VVSRSWPRLLQYQRAKRGRRLMYTGPHGSQNELFWVLK
jgi:hypothetical protein